MAATQEYGIVQLGFSAIRPVHDVVGVGESEPTGWEAAAAVSGIERTAKRRWDGAGLAAYIQYRAVS